MAHPQHDAVRQRFQFRCGYCGVSELETGGELTVDHYRPLSADGDDSEGNLIYCCFRCNTYKGDFYPSGQDIQREFRILHPLQDETTAHVRENQQTGHLEALTATGTFHIELLRLNRPQLVQLRLARRWKQLLIESHRLLQAENEQLQRQIALLENYLKMLTK